MVEFTNEPIAGRERLARTCWKCRQLRWRQEFPNLWAKRCTDCTERLLAKCRCRNCGDSTEPIRNKEPRYYCQKPKCQEQRRLDAGAAAGRARHRKFYNAKFRVCVICGKRKALTVENFTPNKRDEDGLIVYFSAYCRPCDLADKRQRYDGNPEWREKARARAAQHRRRLNERRENDPEFDERFREHHNELNRRYRARRRLRTQQADRRQQPTSSGPEMPAGPLMRAIEAWSTREGLDEITAAARLGVPERRFWDWRRRHANTRMSVADKCLLEMELNWFDVWDPSEYPKVARIWGAA